MNRFITVAALVVSAIWLIVLAVLAIVQRL